MKGDEGCSLILRVASDLSYQSLFSLRQRERDKGARVELTSVSQGNRVQCSVGIVVRCSEDNKKLGRQ